MTFSMGHEETREGRARKEMVQVAAVAASILEETRFGVTDFLKPHFHARGTQGYAVLDEIRDERMRQDEKWGAGRSHTEIEYAMILAEEIGEWAEEIVYSNEDGGAGYAIEALIASGEKARAWIEQHEWPERQQDVIDAEAEEPAACSMCGHVRYLRICVDRSCLCRCYTEDGDDFDVTEALQHPAWASGPTKKELEQARAAAEAMRNLTPERVAELRALVEEDIKPPPIDYPEDGSYIVAEVDPQCLERWPECVDGAYDPQCCRWPKSCSCEVIR